MRCPHCNRRISDKTFARQLAAKAGRTITVRKSASSRRNLPKPLWAVVDPRGRTVSAHHKRERAELVAGRISRRTGIAHRTEPISGVNAQPLSD